MTRLFQCHRVKGVAAFVLFALVSAFPACSDGAEISCVVLEGDWSSGTMAEWYPSGRHPNRDTCTTVLIKGAIEIGDSVKFAQLLQRNHPFLDHVLLWSPGGSVEEAMQIGRLIRKDLLYTEAPEDLRQTNPPAGQGILKVDLLTAIVGVPLLSNDVCVGVNCHCASACFLIWSAGAMRRGSALGLHRPAIQSTSFAALPPDRASVLYRQLLMNINSYLNEMEVPRRFIEVMTDTSSSDIRWLNGYEASAMRDVPSITEWIGTACGKMSPAERSNISQNKELLRRWDTITECEAKKITAARDAAY